VEDVEAMDAALDAANVEHEVVVYDGAQHAFFNDTRASYDEAAALDAWEQTLGWFETYL
jgi:carboxymethylenebutenolidase